MARKSVPVLFETDVLVAGGGPAGLCAAVASARSGARTAVIEQWPMLGGQSTMCRVCYYHTSDRTREVIFGLTQEFIERLKRHGGITQFHSFPRAHETYVFSPEWMSIVCDELVRENKVRTLCYTPCVDVRTSGRRIKAIVVSTKRGLREIRASVFVDATGDADVGALAGCETLGGRESDGRVQGMTMLCSFFNPDASKLGEMNAAFGTMQKRMEEMRKRGELPQFGGHDWVGNDIYGGGQSQLGCTIGDPLDAEDLTRAAMEARAKLPVFLRFFRENWPGCQDLVLNRIAPALGVRESRRIPGLYTFTKSDVYNLSNFHDAIGHGFWPVDLHDPDGTGYSTYWDGDNRLKAGTTYQIPYRILVARDMDNLLMAGRCASATHEGMAALRIQSHCHVMGQAAGAAAAMCLEAGLRPADVDVPALQQRLIKQGVWIDMDRARSARND